MIFILWKYPLFFFHIFIGVLMYLDLWIQFQRIKSISTKWFKSTCLVKAKAELNFKIKDIIIQRSHVKLGSWEELLTHPQSRSKKCTRSEWFFVKFNFWEFQVLGKGGNLSFFFLVQEPALEMVCASVGYMPVSFLPIKPLQNPPSAQ